MTKLYEINLKLTKAQAEILLTVVKAAVNNDKTRYYTESGVNELTVAARQIKYGYTGEPAIGDL